MWLEIELGEKRTEMPTASFPVIPLTRPRDAEIPAAELWLQCTPATRVYEGS